MVAAGQAKLRGTMLPHCRGCKQATASLHPILPEPIQNPGRRRLPGWQGIWRTLRRIGRGCSRRWIRRCRTRERRWAASQTSRSSCSAQTRCDSDFLPLQQTPLQCDVSPIFRVYIQLYNTVPWQALLRAESRPEPPPTVSLAGKCW